MYGLILRKPAPAEAGGGAIEGNAADDGFLVIREGEEFAFPGFGYYINEVEKKYSDRKDKNH